MPLTHAHPQHPAGAPLPFGSVLRRCLAAGALGGFASALVALLATRPLIGAAIAIEGARPSDAAAHPELVGRTAQIIGGALTAVVVGIALGAVFAVAWAALRPHVPAATDFGRALLVGGAGFVSMSLMPLLKYPPAPPGVGDPTTVAGRTWAYLTLVPASVLVLLAVGLLAESLVRRGTAARLRRPTVFMAGIAGLGLVMAVWPANSDVIPGDIPAQLLWNFRIASVAQWAALWSVLTVAAGVLLDRSSSAESPPVQGSLASDVRGR